jgi:pSer/pThr/pTyr-binding forkhead associated (FHA) protein
MYSLIVQTGKHKGKEVPLPEHEVTIGRDDSCFIRMTSAEVSRLHCALVATDRGLHVRDLRSQNGTIVNNVRIDAEALLQPGDFLQVGPVQFQVAGVPSRMEAGTKTSDEDIFGWLSSSETSTEIPNASDTTIVKVTELKPLAKVETKPTFKSIAEEARDIIRRHKESLERESQDESK